MKKVYSKPVIVFENFSLSTNIAGDCDVKTNTPNSGTCAYEHKDEFLGVVKIFIDGITECTTKEADGEYDGLCYHIPLGNNSLFNS